MSIADSFYLADPAEETDLLFTSYIISIDDDEDDFILPNGYFLPCYFLTPDMEDDDG